MNHFKSVKQAIEQSVSEHQEFLAKYNYQEIMNKTDQDMAEDLEEYKVSKRREFIMGGLYKRYMIRDLKVYLDKRIHEASKIIKFLDPNDLFDPAGLYEQLVHVDYPYELDTPEGEMIYINSLEEYSKLKEADLFLQILDLDQYPCCPEGWLAEQFSYMPKTDELWLIDEYYYARFKVNLHNDIDEYIEF